MIILLSSQVPHFSVLQHNPGGEGHWIGEDDDCLCLFSNLHTALDFFIKATFHVLNTKVPYKAFLNKSSIHSLNSLPYFSNLFNTEENQSFQLIKHNCFFQQKI